MMINTSIGPLDSTQLEKRVLRTDNERESTQRVEYWFQGMCVRSDAHINLKQGIGIEGIFGRHG